MYCSANLLPNTPTIVTPTVFYGKHTEHCHFNFFAEHWIVILSSYEKLNTSVERKDRNELEPL